LNLFNGIYKDNQTENDFPQGGGTDPNEFLKEYRDSTGPGYRMADGSRGGDCQKRPGPAARLEAGRPDCDSRQVFSAESGAEHPRYLQASSTGAGNLVQLEIRAGISALCEG
jgi:hypothetical protein